MGMIDVAGTLRRRLLAAGIQIQNVSIGDRTDKKTWTVDPLKSQKLSENIIAAFDITAPDEMVNVEIVALEKRIEALEAKIGG
jgi:hypothetical protein